MVEPDKQPHTDDPQQSPEGTSIGTVTQITPEDILLQEGPIAPGGRDQCVSQEKVEEDVVSINPTPESMESRG